MTALLCDTPGAANDARNEPLNATITRYKVEDIDPVLRDTLLALTLPEGEMAKVYATCANPKRRAWKGHAIVACTGDEVVGWALRWQNGYQNNEWVLHLFVAPAWRRHGVGRDLVAAARYRLNATTWLRGFGWDQASESFWNGLDVAQVKATIMK